MCQTSPIVFVVDDDISVRESLELLLQNKGWDVETFTSGEGFLNHPRAFAPSCLVLDISMPGLNGLELQKRVAIERPDMPIIFITGRGDIPMTVQAMKAGAVEFLTKPVNDETLLTAIQNAIERSKLLVGRDAELRALKLRYAGLTSREREVFALVVSGLANKQVGSELGISEITVKAHRGSLMRKMEADSFAELVGMAARLRVTRPAGATARDQLVSIQSSCYHQCLTTDHTKVSPIRSSNCSPSSHLLRCDSPILCSEDSLRGIEGDGT